MVYPLIGGLIFWHFAGLSILDGIYFSLISIFTIGYGDTMVGLEMGGGGFTCFILC